jgi:hypothetical protein
MKITELKSLMKEINEPNEFILKKVEFDNSLYWLYIGSGLRLKTLKFDLSSVRSRTARYDVFINGLFISNNDYILEHFENDIYIKFMKDMFPPLDRFGNIYELELTDEIKIKGDIEKINGEN